jgi:1-deoxy-D-xylulose-5-phosphate reductoisomerase
MRHIALLGSTGSIGTNTLEVIARNRDRFKLVGIAAGENIDLLTRQVEAFSPEVIAVKRKQDADTLKRIFPGKGVYFGREGLLEVVAHPVVDTMVSAINGTQALEATMASIRSSHRVCLANKETLVAAGELINRALQDSGAELIPIDSEQSAIFQSLGFNQKDFIKKIILTASGGPFFRTAREEFARITVKEALAHPTWAMGGKITIDSATLMNKALEVIEAYYLFHLRNDQIDVIIHPQSIVHSMVEFIDSSIIAQLSVPDMKLPILYSFSYPERIPFESENGRLNFSTLGKLEFFPVDTDKFGSITMAFHVLEQGKDKNAGAVLNAANEVAVAYFLQEKISFSDIFSVVENILYHETFYPVHSLEDVLETIQETKRKTERYIKEEIHV